MSEVVVNEPLAEASAPSSASVLPKLFQIAWRNVWRNKRRTLLTVGGIIFAVWLLVFMRSFQVGVFFPDGRYDGSRHARARADPRPSL
jgi:hypothetical protein